ncbi:MAG: transposase, partial [Alphaproteobacteria bacterium]
MNRLLWLSDEQWARIEPLLPHFGSPERKDDRRVLSGISHVLRTGMPWLERVSDILCKSPFEIAPPTVSHLRHARPCATAVRLGLLRTNRISAPRA